MKSEIKTWNEFLNELLEKKQILAFKDALKADAKVYFYGSGLGKSVIVDVLQSFGYEASEPSMYTGFNCSDIPKGNEYICFEVKNMAPKKLIIDLREQLRSQKNEFIEWIQSN